MKIAVGSDHAAYEFKLDMVKYMEELGHQVEDVGSHGAERTNYPIWGEAVSKQVTSGRSDVGILFCGSGVGMAISANKVRGIRAVVCSEPYSAALSRRHNNCNVLCLGARVVGPDLAKMIIKEWLEAEFEGGRHAERVDLITELEAREEKDSYSCQTEDKSC